MCMNTCGNTSNRKIKTVGFNKGVYFPPKKRDLEVDGAELV